MRKYKRWIIFVLIVLALGVWLGINIGRNQPLFTNPFSTKSALQQRMERKTGKVVDQAKRRLRKSLED